MNTPFGRWLRRVAPVVVALLPFAAPAQSITGFPTNTSLVGATLAPLKTDAGWALRVDLTLPSSGYVIDWKVPAIDGPVIRVGPRVTPPSGPALTVITRATHTYPLPADLAPGAYRAELVIDGTVRAMTSFLVPTPMPPAPPAVSAGLRPEKTDAGWKVHARLQFADPYLVVEWPEAPVREERRLTLEARSQRIATLVAIDRPPVFEKTYELGALEDGRWEVVLKVDGRPVAGAPILVGIIQPPPPPPRPPAFVSLLQPRLAEGAWSVELGLAITQPDLDVTSWGEATWDGNRLVLAPVLAAPPVQAANTIAPLPDNSLPPVTLPWKAVRHVYPVGAVAPGAYRIAVRLGDRVVADRPWVVPQPPPPAPAVTAVAEIPPLAEPAEAASFKVRYRAPAGLDLASVRAAPVTLLPQVIPANVRIAPLVATVEDVESLEDGKVAIARYRVVGPGGDWGTDDRGAWVVRVEPGAVKDVAGGSLARGELGVLRALLLPPPPQPGPQAVLAASRTDAGLVTVTATLPVPVWIDKAAIDWGRFETIGRTLVVRIRFLKGPPPEVTLPAEEMITHSWEVGSLPPGPWVFLLQSDLRHRGRLAYEVPGDYQPGIEGWRERMIPVLLAGADGSVPPEVLAAYAFALNPERPGTPTLAAKLSAAGDGALQVSFLRAATAEGLAWVIEGTADFKAWREVLVVGADASVRDLGDGREEVTVTLPASAIQGLRAFRVRVRLAG